MKDKKIQILTAVLFCGFLGIMSILCFCLPKRTFSQREKRYLEKAPSLTWESLTSGQWGEDAESYLADHIPGRDFFVGLHAYYEKLTGRQRAGEIWTWQDYLLEAPKKPDQKAVQKNMKAINGLAAALDRDLDLMIVPSTGWAAGLEAYRDQEILEDIRARADSRISWLDLQDTFRGRPEAFYRTDHHWTSRGAFDACNVYLEHKGLPVLSPEAFQIETVPGFQGSTYSRSALWLTPAEPLELWQGSEKLTAENREDNVVHPGVFYRENLENPDKYTVFLGGNHSLVRICNPDQQGKLLVIRDSFSNCLGCFLAERYGEVVLVDLRYLKTPISQIAMSEAFDDILVCYSLGNFLTDKNLVMLR